MINGENTLEIVQSIAKEFFMIGDPIVMIILKEQYTVIPMRIDNKNVEEFGVIVSIINAINTRAQLPIIFLHLEDVVIISLMILFSNSLRNWL